MAKKEKEFIDLTQLSPDELDEYKSKKRKTAKQALKYALCTASAGLIEFLTFTILTTAIPEPGQHVNFINDLPLVNFVATVVALTLSILWNFTINRKFTFKSAGNVPRAMFLAFLFYVPFFPFKLWFNGAIPQYIVQSTQGIAFGSPAMIAFLKGSAIGLGIEVISMLMNGVLEFCWQKFVIYRNEEDSALAKYSVGQVGEFGEITAEQNTFTGDEIYEMLHAGVDIAATDDKKLTKWLKANNKK